MVQSLWKVELIINESRYLAEEISKQSVEGVTYCLYERREMKKELLSKKELKIGDLKNSQPIPTAKKNNNNNKIKIKIKNK